MIKKLLFFILGVFLFASYSKAQVGNYVFSPSSGTYSSLSGGTTSTATGDDGVQNVSLGFNFVFGGVTYTNVVISTNGSLKLATDGATGFATSWGNNLSNTYGAPIIAPLWDDDNATGGSVSYLTQGTSPAQTFTVEWQNIHIGGGGSSSNPTATFKVILYEGTNAIQIQYGTVNAFSSTSASIGLNDLTSFLSVTPGTPATASSAAANNSLSDATNLTSGTTYLFFPPACAAPTAPTSSAITSNSATISWTASGSATSYNWEIRTSGSCGSGSPVQSGTTTGTSVNLTGLSPATTYTYCISSGCAGPTTSAWASSTFVTNCVPLTSLPWTENFDALTTGTNIFPTCWNYSNTSSTWSISTSPTAYSGANSLRRTWSTDGWAFTPMFTLTAGVSYDFSYYVRTNDATVGYDITIGVGNGQTSAAMTTTLSSVTGYQGPSWTKYTYSFVPSASGDYSFGVHVVAGFSPNGINFDDFKLDLTPSCPAPNSISVGSITSTSASVTFAGSGSSYIVEYGAPGFTPGIGATAGTGGTVVTGTGSPITISGLTPSTAYDVYVRQDCGIGGIGPNSAVTNFITACAPVSALPWSENFDGLATVGTTSFPSCWTKENGDWKTANNATTSFDADARSVPNFLQESWSATNEYIWTPGFQLTAGTSYDFSFWFADYDGSTSWVGDVFYNTAPNSAGATQLGASFLTNGTAAPTVYTQVKRTFVPSVSGVYYFAIRINEATGAPWYLNFDDFNFDLTPPCPAPSAVTVGPVSSTTASVSFTSAGSSFILEYGPAGFTPGTGSTAGTGGTVIAGSGSPIAITGLTPNTAYDVYVRQDCGGPISTNSNVVTFITECANSPLPITEGFNTSGTSVFPDCWKQQYVSGTKNISFQSSSSFPTTTPYEGTGYVFWNAFSYTGGSQTRLVSLPITTTGTPSVDVNFQWFNENSPYYTDLSEGVQVQYSLDGVNWINAGSSFPRQDATLASGTGQWKKKKVTLPAGAGNQATIYVGFLFTSAFGDNCSMDKVEIKSTPLIDVGPTAVIAPPLTCPLNAATLQATVKNYNLNTLNMATNPVTVTATISGAGSGTLTKVLNSGTLATGATINASLTPTFNFGPGTYTIHVTTSVTGDGDDTNDAYDTTIFVNTPPPAPVITPSAPAVCAGNTVQLSTQFASTPTPVTVSSGSISVAVPDASATGVTSTLAVSGVPAGATITGIDITINLTHTWDGDMTFNLKAPNGNILNLINQRGGSGDNFVNTIISSAGVNPISGGSAPFTGTYSADGATSVGPTGYTSNVTNFSNLYSAGNGSWILAMRDNASGDLGTLTSWSIKITYVFASVTWTPITGLYTNSGATTAYTAGTNAGSIYAKPTATTTYTVTTTSLVGCTNTGAVTVTVNPLPVPVLAALPSQICYSDTLITLNATPIGGVWSGVGVTGNNFRPYRTSIGSYTLTYTYTNSLGCTGSSSVVANVLECPERMRPLDRRGVIIYPNPNNGQFNIKVNSDIFSYLGMKVYNTTGSLVHQQNFSGLHYGTVIPVNMKSLPAGVYQVYIYYDAGVSTESKSFPVIIGH